jgi:hypothetical protein
MQQDQIHQHLRVVTKDFIIYTIAFLIIIAPMAQEHYNFKFFIIVVINLAAHQKNVKTFSLFDENKLDEIFDSRRERV